MTDIGNRQFIHVSEWQSKDDAVNVIGSIKWYEMDWNDPAATDDGLLTIEVNKIDFSIDYKAREWLLEINPLAQSNSFVTDIYLLALEVLRP